MAEKIFAGVSVTVTDEGYLTIPSQWTKEIAIEIAKEEGLALTDKHFAIIEYLRERVLKGETLTIRSIGKSGVVDTKGFYELFHGASLKKATKIARVAKAVNCV